MLEVSALKDLLGFTNVNRPLQVTKVMKIDAASVWEGAGF